MEESLFNELFKSIESYATGAGGSVTAVLVFQGTVVRIAASYFAKRINDLEGRVKHLEQAELRRSVREDMEQD